MIHDTKAWLLPEEEKLIISFLKKDFNYLEWGVGHSTEVFSPLVKKTLTIEHDPKWGEFTRKQIMKLLAEGKILNVEIFIRELGPEYINAPKDKGKFDVVLIDGRDRVKCAYAVLDNNYLNSNGIVIIHDWERVKYKVVLNRYDIILETRGLPSGEKGLGILKPKT